MSDHDRANELYWESEASVNDIAERLDLSKSMLYQLIEPLAAEVDCPDCGSMLVYPNRTALDKGLMQCPDCGREDVSAEDVAEEPADLPVRSPRGRGRASAGARGGYVPVDPVADRQAILGAGLLGAAALLWLLRKA